MAMQQQDVEELRARLCEAEETLDALRQGDVDAVVVSGASGPKVYTLQDADRPYRIIVERMQEGALTLSPDGTVLFANRRLAALLRVGLEAMIGFPFQRFVLAGERERFARLLAESGNSGVRAEFALRAADGGDIAVSMSAIELPDQEQQIISAIVTDLTLQKQQNRELAEMNAKLLATMAEQERVEGKLREAQKMEAVGRLTAGIAHDFNNLLMAVAGNLELIQTHAMDDRLLRRLEISQRAIQRGAQLTYQLLAFARRRTLNPAALRVNDLLRESEPLLRRAVGDEVRLVLALGEEVGACLIDPGEFQAAMLNLVINARDAMPAGGSLTIATGEVALDELSREGGSRPHVMVAVSDTGHGMPDEVRERAFDPFFTTKEVGKGTGLGLSQIYGFIHQSDGHTAIDSTVGVGTSIKLYFPRTAARAAAESQVAASVAPIAADARTVLVVEDNSDVREFLTETLEHIGHTVIEAPTGPAALRVLESGVSVDAVVTDVLMPDGMSGFELASRIRHRLPRTAIVVTSGAAAFSAPPPEAIRDIPILHKPFRRDELLRALGSALDRSKAEA
ncbi:MAG TPA: ATP-binding protein [Stellaceae bacterium]|nr:ATP-binding protein [Stellaceae bacterium]